MTFCFERNGRNEFNLNIIFRDVFVVVAVYGLNCEIKKKTRSVRVLGSIRNGLMYGDDW